MTSGKSSSVSTRRQAILGAAMALGEVALASRGWAATPLWVSSEDTISHAEESIHQEPVFKAGGKRVYEALTDPVQFDKVVQLSAAMQAHRAGAAATEISREVGGTFSLFGGYITGRHIELAPNRRIVQAWRAGSWAPGMFSIARFELAEAGSGTKIIFDHTGFPKGEAKHLAEGWHDNYWEPLAKVLG